MVPHEQLHAQTTFPFLRFSVFSTAVNRPNTLPDKFTALP
jgi:hypothetical protein